MLEMQESVDSIPEVGRSPGMGKNNLLQYSCLEDPIDRGAWGATVHEATKSLTNWATEHVSLFECTLTYLISLELMDI